MKIEEFRFELLKKSSRLTAFFRRNYGTNVSEKEMKRALARYADIYLDEFLENADEALFDPRFAEHQMLLRLLPEGNIFNGYRSFSREKLAAMIVYFVSVIGIKLSKTKLNKLAFYSDFRHFSKHGKSISGSSYKHLPHGPVLDSYETIIDDLTAAGVVALSSGKDGWQAIEVRNTSIIDDLSVTEKLVLDSVGRDFGKLSAAAVSDLSHQEVAYKNTRTGEYIAYGYADLLQK